MVNLVILGEGYAQVLTVRPFGGLGVRGEDQIRIVP
jgi:hypothetical protein